MSNFFLKIKIKNSNFKFKTKHFLKIKFSFEQRKTPDIKKIPIHNGLKQYIVCNKVFVYKGSIYNSEEKISKFNSG